MDDLKFPVVDLLFPGMHPVTRTPQPIMTQVVTESGKLDPGSRFRF